jgi:TFIIF-interacting CTD phosphatase-like protein
MPYSNKRRIYESDLIVVLDLDECLVHGRVLADETAPPRAKEKREYQEKSCPTPALAQDKTDSFPASYLYPGSSGHRRKMDVYVRPGLLSFLRHVTQKYETHIMTASGIDHADSMLDVLCAAVRNDIAASNDDSTAMTTKFGDKATEAAKDLPPIFAGRWYQHHCRYDSVEDRYIKTLSCVKRGEHSRIVLVDNNSESFENPANGILVDDFWLSPTDTALQDVRALIDSLDPLPDVRPFLAQHWLEIIRKDEEEQQQSNAPKHELFLANQLELLKKFW